MVLERKKSVGFMAEKMMIDFVKISEIFAMQDLSSFGPGSLDND